MDELNLHQGHRKRMVERFLSNPDGFSDHEIMEVVLYSAIPRKDVNELAHKLLRVCGSLSGVFNAENELLLSIDGIGPAVVTHIRVIGQLLKRIYKDKPKKEKFVFCKMKPKLIDMFKGETNEKFLLYLLDKNQFVKGVLEYDGISCEEINFDVREFAKTIAVLNPESAVLVHNHPSGDVSPSFTDDLTTKKMAVMLRVHAVNLYDHIIVGKDDAFSYHFSDKLSKLLENIKKEL